MEKFLICVFGNILIGQDSLCLKVFYNLEKEENFKNLNIKWIDCATDPFSIYYFHDKYEKIIIVDNAEMGIMPGEVKILKKENISEKNIFRSAHSISIKKILDLIDKEEKVFIIGVETAQKINNELINKAGKNIIKKIKTIIQEEKKCQILI